MTASSPPTVTPTSEEERASPGIFNFLLSKLGRAQRSDLKANSTATSSGSAQQVEQPQTKDEGGRCMRPAPGNCQGSEKGVSLPKATVSSRAASAGWTFRERKRRQLEIEALDQIAEAARIGDDCTLESTFPLSGRSASDSADWDFRRREVRRNSRSAQEWVRSTADSQSEWSKGLQAYNPDKEPLAAPLLGTGKSRQLSPRHIEEGGMCFRRRSRSAKELTLTGEDNSDNLRPSSGRHLVSAENIRKSSDSKRNSFEAGLDQDLRASTPCGSAEKVRRPNRGEPARGTDFLPTELIERSLLFNAQSRQ